MNTPDSTEHAWACIYPCMFGYKARKPVIGRDKGGRARPRQRCHSMPSTQQSWLS